VQLIEAETGAHLLVDRFVGSLEDIFDLQDSVRLASLVSSNRHCRLPKPRGRPSALQGI